MAEICYGSVCDPAKRAYAKRLHSYARGFIIRMKAGVPSIFERVQHELQLRT